MGKSAEDWHSNDDVMNQGVGPSQWRARNTGPQQVRNDANIDSPKKPGEYMPTSTRCSSSNLPYWPFGTVRRSGEALSGL